MTTSSMAPVRLATPQEAKRAFVRELAIPLAACVFLAVALIWVHGRPEGDALAGFGLQLVLGTGIVVLLSITVMASVAQVAAVALQERVERMRMQGDVAQATAAEATIRYWVAELLAVMLRRLGQKSVEEIEGMETHDFEVREGQVIDRRAVDVMASRNHSI